MDVMVKVETDISCQYPANEGVSARTYCVMRIAYCFMDL